MLSPFEFLPRYEAVFLSEIVNKLLRCDSCDTYRDIFSDINSFIPFEYATSGLVSVSSSGVVESYDLANINFTDDWIAAYSEQEMYLVDVTVKENFNNFQTQCWSETFKKYDNPKRLLSFAHDYRLTNGYSCGAKSFGLYNKPSMISFVWNFKNKSKYTWSIIDWLAPHIHVALTSALYSESRKIRKELLTRREREVLGWVKEGKSSWDISNILDISETTVNFHVANIMVKLNSVNRAQAVAVALKHGIIEFD